MKILVAVWSLFSLAFALGDEPFGDSFKINEQDLEVSNKIWEEYKTRLSKYEDGDGGVIAVINEFADRLLANIETLAQEDGLDPIPLDGFDDNFLVARVTLSNGSLEGLSTVSRDGDIVANYQISTGILNLKIPIKFDHIRFEYKFYVFLFLLGHSGKLTGNIDCVKVYIELSFDFNDYQAKLNKLSMVNTGHISIHVEGGIIEVVLSILSELMTTIIHPLIIGVIQTVIKTAVNIVVNIINTVINNILHPDAVALLF